MRLLQAMTFERRSMPTEPWFHPLADAVTPVTVHFNGHALQVPAASSVAAALLAAGVKRFRNSPVSGAGRAPYCMMGVCFECLLEVDGTPNRQGCLVPLRDGMHIRTQDSLPDSADDLTLALARAKHAGAHHGV
jgi:predicted molibdopterin-dependent oxidoreductase YjgC